MSETPWWKKEEALKLQRKGTKARNQRGVNLGDSFLIVTEGTVTEPIYFRGLRDNLRLSTVEIHIQPGDGSHPLDVIATAARIARNKTAEMKKSRDQQAFTKLAGFDHIWAVIDTDVAVKNEIWEDVKAEAARQKVRLASSTPCFEYWLLLHLDDTTAGIPNGKAAKAALKAAGFNCSTTKAAQASVKHLLPRWPDAVKRAAKVREYHFHGRTPEPANPSTDVDLLIQLLDDSVQQHRRRL